MRIPVTCDAPELEAVHTTPQEQMTLAYVQILEEQLRHTKALMLRAQVYLAIGQPEKANAALSQGVSS